MANDKLSNTREEISIDIPDVQSIPEINLDDDDDFEEEDANENNNQTHEQALTINSPLETEESQERFSKLKSMMLAEMSSSHVPLTSFSTNQIVLPSEHEQLRDYAIGVKKRRDEFIRQNTFRHRRGSPGINDSHSVSTFMIKSSPSIEALNKMEEGPKSRFSWITEKPLVKSITKFAFEGPFWKELKQKPPKYNVKKEDISDVQATIIDLGYALSIYGIPAHRLEYHLALISSYYSLNCTSYCTPTGLWITFGNYVDDPDASTHFVKIRSSAFNLSKLCLLDDIAERISKGNCTIKDARKMIKKVIEMQPIYSHFMFIIFSCFIQAGMFSIFFAANWGEILASFIAGLFVGILTVVSSKFESFAQVNTVLCAILAGLVGVVFRIMLSSLIPISAFVVSLSGVISLLPGLTFTLAIAELSTRNLLSGSTRLISAFVTTIQISFGVLVSDRLSNFLPQVIDLPEVKERHLYHPSILAAIIPVVAIATIITFKAPKYPVAVIFILLDAFAGFFATFYCVPLLGPEVATMIGALVVGTIANIFQLISLHPGIVVSACGIIFLLPASLGHRSVSVFLDDDPAKGLTFLFDNVIMAVSLTIGLMLSDVFVLKRKKLNL
jgi:uncharacterized membrane protein YjjP (DUF1212 family)